VGTRLLTGNAAQIWL